MSAKFLMLAQAMDELTRGEFRSLASGLGITPTRLGKWVDANLVPPEAVEVDPDRSVTPGPGLADRLTADAEAADTEKTEEAPWRDDGAEEVPTDKARWAQQAEADMQDPLDIPESMRRTVGE